jgi:hypothetical protein
MSRRGSVTTIAREVTNVLKEDGYRVRTRDHDFPITAISRRCTKPLRTRETSSCCSRATTSTRLTLKWSSRSFESNVAQSAERRRMRREDAPLLGLLAPHVYQEVRVTSFYAVGMRSIADAVPRQFELDQIWFLGQYSLVCAQPAARRSRHDCSAASAPARYWRR